MLESGSYRDQILPRLSSPLDKDLHDLVELLINHLASLERKIDGIHPPERDNDYLLEPGKSKGLTTILEAKIEQILMKRYYPDDLRYRISNLIQYTKSLEKKISHP